MCANEWGIVLRFIVAIGGVTAIFVASALVLMYVSKRINK